MKETLEKQANRIKQANRNRLHGCQNGYHFCDCGSQSIISKDESTCVVCGSLIKDRTVKEVNQILGTWQKMFGIYLNRDHVMESLIMVRVHSMKRKPKEPEGGFGLE